MDEANLVILGYLRRLELERKRAYEAFVRLNKNLVLSPASTDVLRDLAGVPGSGSESAAATATTATAAPANARAATAAAC